MTPRSVALTLAREFYLRGYVAGAEQYKATWDESAHPRQPAGKAEGGEWTAGHQSNSPPWRAMKGRTAGSLEIRLIKSASLSRRMRGIGVPPSMLPCNVMASPTYFRADGHSRHRKFPPPVSQLRR